MLSRFQKFVGRVRRIWKLELRERSGYLMVDKAFLVGVDELAGAVRRALGVIR